MLMQSASQFSSSTCKQRRDGLFGSSVQDSLLLLFGPAMAAVAKFNHDWEYSCVITLGQCSMCLAIAQVLLRLLNGDHTGPVSTQALWVTLVGLFARLIPTSFIDAYTPVDNTGSWLCQASDAVSIVLTIATLHLLRKQGDQQKTSYENRLVAPLTLLATLIFAIMCHSDADGVPAADVSWAFGAFALTAAPSLQLLRLVRAPLGEGAAPWAFLVPLTSSAIGASAFWFAAYQELYVLEGNVVLSTAPGTAVYAAHVMLLILLASCLGVNVRRTIQTSPVFADFQRRKVDDVPETMV